MLRVNRFAAAIDMIAAGTSAPMAIAANAKPTNQDGNIRETARGPRSWRRIAGSRARTRASGRPRGDGHVPEQRDESEQEANTPAASRVLRRMTARPLELSTPVIEWGYRNSASADPRASVAYALDCPRVARGSGACQDELRRRHRGEDRRVSAELHGMTIDRGDRR